MDGPDDIRPSNSPLQHSFAHMNIFAKGKVVLTSEELKCFERLEAHSMPGTHNVLVPDPRDVIQRKLASVTVRSLEKQKTPFFFLYKILPCICV